MSKSVADETRAEPEETEKHLAERLKELCDKNGKETNPQESAKLIHDIGRVYRQRSPDKLSLIRSAILFNGALVRKPDNVEEVEADLRELCSHVLQRADADDKSADLVEKAKALFHEIKEMRDTVNEVLNIIHPIPSDVFGEKYAKLVDELVSSMEQLQDFIYRCYSRIMRKIMEFSIKAMGRAPCKYVLAGMGSFVTKEITPYSDFESLIVLEDGVQDRSDYEEILEYFRWVATIFQLILVNFGETVIYDAAIPSLNHPENDEDNWFYDAFTPCGISPDGFYPHASHNPLGYPSMTEGMPGKSELIKPVSEMLKYLETEGEAKNESNLAEVLTKTCYVLGDEELYDFFSEEVKKKSAEQTLIDRFRERLTKDLQKFNVSKGLMIITFNADVNHKQVIYRAITMSITAIARLRQMDIRSSFDLIDKLSSLLSDEFLRKLKYAVAMGCVVRLKTYMSQGRQEDYLPRGEYENEIYTSSIVKILGCRSACDFVITVIHLQEFASRLVNETSKDKKTTSVNEAILSAITGSIFRGSSEKHMKETDKVMRMMDCSVKERAGLFEANVQINYYMMCSEIMHRLGEYVSTLQYCQHMLDVRESPTFFDVLKVWDVVWAISLDRFSDDDEIQNKWDEFAYKRMLDGLGLNRFPKRALEAVSPIPGKPSGSAKRVSSHDRELLRSAMLTTLDKMKQCEGENQWCDVAASVLPNTSKPVIALGQQPKIEAQAGESCSDRGDNEKDTPGTSCVDLGQPTASSRLGKARGSLTEMQNHWAKEAFAVPGMAWKSDENAMANQLNTGLVRLVQALTQQLQVKLQPMIQEKLTPIVTEAVMKEGSHPNQQKIIEKALPSIVGAIFGQPANATESFFSNPGHDDQPPIQRNQPTQNSCTDHLSGNDSHHVTTETGIETNDVMYEDDVD